jgi:hypothetical protein
MADATLLVPGTQATTLIDQDGRVVFNAIRVALGLSKKELEGYPPDSWLSLLSMEHRPGDWAPVRTSLEANVQLFPGGVVRTPYDELSRGIALFGYDWRADLRWNALRLRDYIKHYKPAGGRWNLIGHSQGALLIVLASKLMGGPDDFARHVARVVLIGSPLAGTMRAAEALLFGRNDLGDDHIAISRAFARTWPALFQMLPAWDAMVASPDHPLPPDLQLTVPGGWVEPTGITDDLLQRARETQALLVGPFSYIGPNVATLVLLGDHQQTPEQLVRRSDTYTPPSLMDSGDSLVPAEQTLIWGGSPLGDHVMLLHGNINEHSMLCTDPEVLSLVRRFLAARAPAPPPPRPVIV